MKGLGKVGVSFNWSTIQLNIAACADWHTEDGVGLILNMGLGYFEGGPLEILGTPPIDVQGKAVLHDGRVPHRTHPFRGKRCTILAILSRYICLAEDNDFKLLDILGFLCGHER